MLPLKQGYCPICDDQALKPLINGVCRFHYWGGLRAQTAAPKRTSRILTPIEQEVEQLQEQWYQVKVKQLSGWCVNCGAKIATWNYKYAKASVAHILPKEHFLSIAVHDLNYLELGAACGCHSRWDLSWESARTMTVFPVALERFNVFYSEIALAERKKIPDIFFLHIKA